MSKRTFEEVRSCLEDPKLRSFQFMFAPEAEKREFSRLKEELRKRIALDVAGSEEANPDISDNVELSAEALALLDALKDEKERLVKRLIWA